MFLLEQIAALQCLLNCAVVAAIDKHYHHDLQV
jgi:hypothetical protein